MPFLQASSRLSASTTMCWYIGTRYWRSMTNLGIGFLLLDLPTPQPLPTSISRGGERSAGAERLQSEFGEAFLAGGLVGDVMDHVVLGASDAEEMCELVDHQPDCRVSADRLRVGVFM